MSPAFERAATLWASGVRRTARAALLRLANRLEPPREIEVAAGREHVLSPAADRLAAAPVRGPLTVHWVIPPPTPGGGGHRTVFRLVAHLEKEGHRCRLFVHDPGASGTEAHYASVVRREYPSLTAEVRRLGPELGQCDALVATSWATAYVVRGTAVGRRLYLVQDFEPDFYPAGTEKLLAEETYRFGLRGLSIGPWLADRLALDYGMHCDWFAFPSDTAAYRATNTAERPALLFYARPSTPRRGFELGILALELVAQRRPELTLHLLGEDLSAYRLPFPCISHGVVPHGQLGALYNECAAGLVLSFTNVSLLPLEMLSAGCIPVVNDGPNTRTGLGDAPVRYAAPTPHALADSLLAVIDQPDHAGEARAAAVRIQKQTWEDAGRALLRALRDFGPEDDDR